MITRRHLAFCHLALFTIHYLAHRIAHCAKKVTLSENNMNARKNSAMLRCTVFAGG